MFPHPLYISSAVSMVDEPLWQSEDLFKNVMTAKSVAQGMIAGADLARNFSESHELFVHHLANSRIAFRIAL